MAMFGSSAELYDHMLPFYRQLVADDAIGASFMKAGASFRIIHAEPEATFVLDATGGSVRLLHGEEAGSFDADVDLVMAAEDGHRFWLGRLNLPMSLARKKVKVTGGVTRLLGLIPALQPAYAMYADYLAAEGIAAED